MHHSRDIPAYLPADKPHNAYNTYIYLSETYSRAPSFFNKITTVWAYLQGILRSHAASASAVNSYTFTVSPPLLPGVISTDQAPVNPAHPHCLCHYAPVYASELKGKKRSDNVEGRGNAWLKRQPLHIRQAILGVKGEQEWKVGRVEWMVKARNLNISTVRYYGLKSRLRKFVNGIFGKESTTITYEVLPKIDGNPGIEENAKNTNPNFLFKKERF